MKKKYQTILASCIAAAALLAGCGESHVHQPSDTWDADLTNHWKTCAECGENVEESAHTLDELNACTVCGAQITDWGDSQSLYLFNENGDPLRLSEYDEEGNLTTEMVCRYEHDETGNLTHSTTTVDGVLVEEYTYITVDGENFASQCISYMEDGSKCINEYDAHGNVIRLISYDAEGNVDLQTESEYVLSAQGVWYEATCITTEKDGSWSVGEFSEHGDQTRLASYNADGSVAYIDSWVYTYTITGEWETMTYYRDDVLVYDAVFATVPTEDGIMTYPEIVTEYEEDGSKTTTIYDENDNIISQISYDDDGNVISE